MNDIEKFNNWLNYYNPKFKNIFNFDMPHDIHGIDIFKLGYIIGVPVETSSLFLHNAEIRKIVLEKYGINADVLLCEILDNNPLEFEKEN